MVDVLRNVVGAPATIRAASKQECHVRVQPVVRHECHGNIELSRAEDGCVTGGRSSSRSRYGVDFGAKPPPAFTPMLCAPCSTGLLRDVEAAVRVVDVATVSGANGGTGTAAPVAAPAVARDEAVAVEAAVAFADVPNHKTTGHTVVDVPVLVARVVL